MKPKLCIISLIGILFLSLTACGGIHLDGAYDFRWVLYIKSNDSLLVEYPCDAPYKNEHPITADKEVRWEIMEVYKDTFQRGENWIHGRNLTNVEVHVYRQTSKEDVKMFFVQKAMIYDSFFIMVIPPCFPAGQSPCRLVFLLYLHGYRKTIKVQRKDKKGLSALQSLFLPFHVFHDDIVDLAEGGTIFQHLPGFVGVVVDFDQFVVAHCQQAIPLEVVGKVIVDLVLIQPLAFDQQLCIELELQHGRYRSFAC